jgi:hypothetical protein
MWWACFKNEVLFSNDWIVVPSKTLGQEIRWIRIVHIEQKASAENKTTIIPHVKCQKRRRRWNSRREFSVELAGLGRRIFGVESLVVQSRTTASLTLMCYVISDEGPWSHQPLIVLLFGPFLSVFPSILCVYSQSSRNTEICL